ncbi:hypothetical protein ANANG_G00237040 [Anguilla anguilla]|uniref:Rap-GAP domain-containing protein n=1 Tax=Anguilla anguilla TaxID=7936 RepID=A0A9D3RNP3_ANGAN|nr:hypothetical protein ANANG_G00237040 [Anguilla anguilla]
MSAYRDLLEAGAGPPASAPAHRLPPPQRPLPAPPPGALRPAPHVRAQDGGAGAHKGVAPRRERSHESLLENGHGAGAGAGRGWCGGPARSPPPLQRHGVPRRAGGGAFRPVPLRQRSSSEVTLSEQDEAEAEVRGGLPRVRQHLLHRRAGLPGAELLRHAEPVPPGAARPAQHRPRPPGSSLRAEAPPRPRRLPDARAPPDDGGSAARPENRVRKKSGGTESSLGTSRSSASCAGPAAWRRSRAGRGEEGRPEAGRSWLCPRASRTTTCRACCSTCTRRPPSGPRGPAAEHPRPAPPPPRWPPLAPPPGRPRAGPLQHRGPGPRGPEGPEPGDSAAAAAPAGQLLLGCPHFRNETGGHGERNVSFLSSSGGAERALTLRRSNASVSVLEAEPEQQLGRLEALQHYSVEHVDQGARYYRDYFHGKEHWDYFGTDDKLGPVALSIRREKLEDTKELKDQYQYRLIFRTSELVTLRGSLLEDAVPSTARHGVVRGLPLKEVLEHVVPELSVGCLRLALPVPKVAEQLLKLDEQGLSQKHKVGILLCRAGQSTEEEMYNNEEATPAFRDFLELLGEQVCLRGFTKYAAQLDTKTDSTGTHSLYTTYQNYEVMFHVSTMLPYMPNNPQQLLRKRHIGNDIHVFVIVRVHNPCSDSTCYSVAVTRMKDVPPFGPPIPSGATFRDPAVFRDFLLAKVINAENAAHKSEKFHTMATRTRQEYLRDLAENCVSGTPLDSAGKLNNFILLASKKRERARPREGAELGAAGAYVLLLDTVSKEVVFNCFCADIIGWTPERLALKIYYGRGDHIAIRVPEGYAQDLREVVTRLKALTLGCETVDMTLRRNGLGQLGFHGSRLVEICKVAAVTLSHEQMIDLLRTSVTVKVVIIPPYDEGGPRRGCTEEYEMKTVDQKSEAEPLAAGYRPPLRPPAWRWDSPPVTHNAPPAQRWAPVGPPQPSSRTHKGLVPIPYRDSQHLSKRPVSFPENHYNLTPMGSDRVLPYRNPSASFSGPGAGIGAPGMGGHFVRYKPSSDRYGTPQRPLMAYEPHLSLDMTSSGESSSGFTSQESTMERGKTEPLWHVPASSRGPPLGGAGVQKRPGRQDVPGKDSPNRHLKGEAQYSSHSSSNTLSSNASSSHSDERCGIDAAPLYTPSPNPKAGKATPPKALHGSATYSGLQELAGHSHSAEARRRESSPAVPMPANQSKGYRTRTFPPPSAHTDSYKPSRACYTPQGYKTPSVDKPRPARATTVTPTSGSAQSSAQQLSSSAPKSLYGKSKHSSWQHREDAGTVTNTATNTAASTATNSSSDSSSSSRRQVDLNSKNVFGQPRLRASLRDLRSPRRSHKSTVEDDLKKLIIMDTPMDTPLREASPRRALQRTFSDESLCSGRRDDSFACTPPTDSQASAGDLLFTCTLPTRRHGHTPAQGSLLSNKKVPLSASELSLTEVRDKVPPLRRLDPGLMPLPDTACGLEWTSLVNAAKAFEVQRAVSLFSLTDSQPGGAELQPDEAPNDLSGRLYHLEVMLKQLNNDLEKEKQDKVALLAEMANLRENNQRLQEESLSASEQLRKFSQMFTGPSGDRK